jgi:hypothetical protein
MLLPEDPQVLFLLAFFVGIEPCLLEFMIGYRTFKTKRDELDTLFSLRYFVRRWPSPQLYERSGRIEQFDRLPWK